MIGFVIRSGDHFKDWRSAWVSDVLQAWRFAREEDAQKFISAPDEYIVPVMMAPQWPAELLAVRDAIMEAEFQALKVAQMHAHGWWPTRTAREVRNRAHDAMQHAQKLCYQVFKGAMLRPARTPAKVVLPAKA